MGDCAGFFLIGGGWGLPMKCTNLSVGVVCARPSEVVWEGPRRVSLNFSRSDALYDPYESKIFKCPPGACSDSNQCLQNRSGPVCGTCSIGYAMTTQGCSPQSCPDDQVSPYRLALIVIGSVVGFITYLLIAWRAVFPEIDYVLARILEGIAGLISQLVRVGYNNRGPEEIQEEDAEETAGLMTAVSGGAGLALAKFELLKQKWEQIHGRQYMKIFVRIPFPASFVFSSLSSYIQ